MSDSITKDELDDKLSHAGWGDRVIYDIMNDAFPPKFNPPTGKVVAVWDDGDPDVIEYGPVELVKGIYWSYGNKWDNCRDLNDEEREGL